MKLAEIIREHFRHGLREARQMIEWEQVTVDGKTITAPDAMIALPATVALTKGSKTRTREIHEWGVVDV